MKIILYSTHCPKCNVLKRKLSELNIDFDTCTDSDEMIKKGFMSAPMLEVDGVIHDFKSAINWIKEMRSEGEAKATGDK